MDPVDPVDPVDVSLRPAHDSDPPVFHPRSNDPDAPRTAAFTAEDPAGRDAFEAHWARIRTSPDVVVRTVLGDGDVLGSAAVHGEPGEREVTYGIDRAYRAGASPPPRCADRWPR